MTPPEGALWRPVDQLDDLDVVWRDGRIEVVDRRLWVVLISLAPSQAAALGVVLTERGRRGAADAGPG